MKTQNFLFTSESVSEGHPDKVADQVSDAILDAMIAGDPLSRVACETLVKNNNIILAGEITSGTKIDFEEVARGVIRDIGYTDPALGFDADNCKVDVLVNAQSSDISQGVSEGQGTFQEQGAGDQGLMFGYACNETPEMMPLPIAVAHKLVHELSLLRKSGSVDFLRPDSKSQVSVLYQDGAPTSIETIVISTQHSEDVQLEEIKKVLWEKIVQKVIPAEYLSNHSRFLLNPTGRFVIGGPVGDCGLTGRKIIVDTYGGYGRHGGGAFSGKDPSKVDRSAAYAARYIAKNIIAAEVAAKCEIQLAYAIGVAEPVSIMANTFGTSQIPEKRIVEAIRELFDLTPRGIIESLDLLRPIYQQTAAYGHFGRTPTEDGHFSWEKTDKADAIKKFLSARTCSSSVSCGCNT